MNLLEKTKRDMNTLLEGKQNPNSVIIKSQGFKGYWATCKWGESVEIDFDVTKHYTRMLGDLEDVPNYIKGFHRVPKQSLEEEIQELNKYSMSDERRDEIIKLLEDDHSPTVEVYI